MQITFGLPASFNNHICFFDGGLIAHTVYTPMTHAGIFDSMMLHSLILVMMCYLLVKFDGCHMYKNMILNQIIISQENVPIGVSGAISALSYFMILTIFTKFCPYQCLLKSDIE